MSFLQLAIKMSAVLLPKPWLKNTSLTPSPSGVLFSATRVAVLLVFVLEVGFLCVESPHMVPGIAFPLKRVVLSLSWLLWNYKNNLCFNLDANHSRSDLNFRCFIAFWNISGFSWASSLHLCNFFLIYNLKSHFQHQECVLQLFKFYFWQKKAKYSWQNR